MELGKRFLLIFFSVILTEGQVCRKIIFFFINTIYPTSLQVSSIVIVAVIIAIHGYLQPYRSRLANLLELAVSINFLILLLINTTPFFNEDIFFFSSAGPSSTSECTAGVAQISWLLLPIYYLPILVVSVTAATLAYPFIRLFLYVGHYVFVATKPLTVFL